jgi:hypothetical protein
MEKETSISMQVLYEAGKRVLRREEEHHKKPHQMFYRVLENIRNPSENDNKQEKAFTIEHHQNEHLQKEELLDSVKSTFTYLFFDKLMRIQDDGDIGMALIVAQYQATDLGRNKSLLKRIMFKIQDWWYDPYTEGYPQVAPFDQQAKQKGHEEKEWQTNRLRALMASSD